MDRDDYQPMRCRAGNGLFGEAMRAYRRARPDVVALHDPQVLGQRIRAWAAVVEPRVDADLAARIADPVERRLARERHIMQAMTVAHNHGPFAEAGSNIVTATPALEAMLRRTRLGDVELEDLKLPYEALHVAFSPGVGLGALPGRPNRIDGVYVSRCGDWIEFAVTSRATTPLGHPFVDAEPCASVAQWIELGDLPRTLEEMIERHAAFILDADGEHARVLRNSFSPREGVRAGVAEELATANARAAGTIAEAIRLAVKILCFMTAEPDDRILQTAPDDAPAGLAERAATPDRRGEKARMRLAADGHLPVIIVGSRVAAEAGGVGGHVASRIGHWREGHYRRVRHGQGRALVRIGWIRPTWVHAVGGASDDRDAVEGRVYVATAPA